MKESWLKNNVAQNWTEQLSLIPDLFDDDDDDIDDCDDAVVPPKQSKQAPATPPQILLPNDC